MKMTHLDIEHFGLWSNMRLDGLSDGLNVVYGPNGSGKTTLMQFLRSVFYGLPTQDCDNFIPTVHSGRQGGTVGLVGPGGEFSVSRFAEDEGGGDFVVDSGSPDAESFERMLVSIGESAFQDLFTVGYQEADSFDVLIREVLADQQDYAVDSPEIQEVVRAQRRLADEKRSLLDNGNQSRIQQLAEERERLVGEIERLRDSVTIPVLLNKLRSDIGDVDSQIARIEAQIANLDRSLDGFRGQTDRSVEIRCQPAIPENTSVADDIANLDQQVLKWRRRCREIDEDVVSVKQQLESLHVRHGHSRESARVSHIARTRDCIEQLKQQVRQLQTHSDPDLRDTEQSGSLGSDVEQLRNLVFELCREIGRDETEKRHQSLESEIVQLRRCQEEMRREIGILTGRRDTLIHNYGLEDPEFLRRAVTSLCDCADAEGYVPSLVERPFAKVTPDTSERDRIHREREPLVQQVNQLRTVRERLVAELGPLESELSDSTRERQIQRLQLDLNIVDENLRRATQRWQTLSAADEILSQLQEKYQTQRQPLIVTEASEYLSRLTNGAYERIGPDVDGRSFVVQQADGQELKLNGLSRGTRDQVALSLRLAVASAYARRGQQLPIILDDVFVTSDDDRAEAIALLLRDYANNGQQIVFFTCREQHADLFRSIGVQVRSLPTNGVTPQTKGPEIQPIVVPPSTEPVQALLVPKRATNIDPQIVPPATDSSLVIKAFAAEADELKDRDVNDLEIHPEPWQPTNNGTDGNWIFYLEVDSSIDELPGISPEDIEELASVGVTTVEDLLALVPDAAAMRLSHAGITPEQIRSWQSQAMLSCRIPMLRTRDAWLLVQCSLTNPEQISRMHPEELFAVVDRFLQTPDGRRFVQKNSPFDLQSAINWIRWSRHTRNLWDSRESASAGRSRATVERQTRHTNNDAGASGNGRTINEENERERDGNGHLNGDGHGNPARSTSGMTGLETGAGTAQKSRRKRTRAEKRPRRSATTGSSSPLRRTEQTEQTGRSFTRQGLSTASRGAAEPVSPTFKSATSEWRYYLEKSSPVEDGPSIGPKTAERLAKVGIYSVQDLLVANCEQIAETLDHRRIKADTLRMWQSQAEMVCRIPQLRGHDAQILVACEMNEPSKLASMRAADLFAIVLPFTETSEGERIIRNGKKPDLAEINNWIEWAAHARDLRTA